MKELEEIILKAFERARIIASTREHVLVRTKLEEALMWLRASPAWEESCNDPVAHGCGLPKKATHERMTDKRFDQICNYVWERDRPLTFEESKMLTELACECQRARRAE